MDKTQKRWDKRKHKRIPCICGSYCIHLNRIKNRPFNRYWLECWNCHWCAKSMPTINMAIRAWNKTMKNHQKWYEEHIGDCEQEGR